MWCWAFLPLRRVPRRSPLVGLPCYWNRPHFIGTSPGASSQRIGGGGWNGVGSQHAEGIHISTKKIEYAHCRNTLERGHLHAIPRVPSLPTPLHRRMLLAYHDSFKSTGPQRHRTCIPDQPHAKGSREQQQQLFPVLILFPNPINCPSVLCTVPLDNCRTLEGVRSKALKRGPDEPTSGTESVTQETPSGFLYGFVS